MSATELILDQVMRLDLEYNAQGLNSVVDHLDRALFLYSEGRRTSDRSYFDDSLQRCNKAYEGVLKEAYSIIEQVPISKALKKKPFEIEEYLKSKGLLSRRIEDLLTLYRKEWRNESTHNHTHKVLGYDSFLAIQYVTAFVHVLLCTIEDRRDSIRKYPDLTSGRVDSSFDYENSILKGIKHSINVIKVSAGSSLEDETELGELLISFLANKADYTVGASYSPVHGISVSNLSESAGIKLLVESDADILSILKEEEQEEFPFEFAEEHIIFIYLDHFKQSGFIDFQSVKEIQIEEEYPLKIYKSILT